MGTAQMGMAQDILHTFRRSPRPCDACGSGACIPEYLHFTIHEPVLSSWCSDGCYQVIVSRVLAEAHAYRATLGDMVESAMAYLRRREAIPKKMRYALTEKEYDEVGKVCDLEYTVAHEELLKAMLRVIARKDPAMVSWQQITYGTQTKAVRDHATQPIAVSLWDEV